MSKEKIELEIIPLVKIQAKINGKKSTRRRIKFHFNQLPEDLRRFFISYLGDIKEEINAELRTPKEWVTLIKKSTRVLQLRGWAASIIWWEYGGNEDSVLYDLSKTFDAHENRNTAKQVTDVLERMNCPRIIRNLASGTREAIREKTLRDNRKKFGGGK